MSSPRGLGDEFDDLFDDQMGGEDDPFSENYKVPGKSASTLKSASKVEETESKGKSGSGLGIDEEVEVTRKPRAPRVKLDEHRFVILDLELGQANYLKALVSCWYSKVEETSEGSFEV